MKENVKTGLLMLGSAAAAMLASYLFSDKKENKKAKDPDIKFSRLALALASDYVSVYYLNIKDNSYIEFGTSGSSKKLKIISRGDDFFADIRVNCKKQVYKEDQDRVLATLRKDVLLDTIKNERAFTLNYRLMIDGRPVHYSLKTARGSGKNDKYIVIGVRNVDAQTKREEAANRETEIYNNITKALSSRYEVIYYVDIETDEYTEYSSGEKYTKLMIGNHGHDFFGDTQRNIKRSIYPEDVPMMLVEMQKDRFLAELEMSGTYSITYRLMLDGNPEYVNLRAVRPSNDKKHVIIGVSNIDISMRREMAFKEALGNAMTKANFDSLTGVSNKHAYVDAEKDLNARIANNMDPKFAVAVCDVNNLKTVNDTLGHAAGDEYIKNACKIICDTFKHSPVYRMGGDEFAVILSGEDYENRQKLENSFKNSILENKNTGGVTIAIGIAEHNNNESVAAVFERADSAMYENKEKLKKG